jgi:hypothetical protein
VWDVVATTRFEQAAGNAPAVLLAYVSKTNPWSLSVSNLLSCLPRFFREEDCIFLKVYVDDMTYTEQMHHRLSHVPAFKLFAKVIQHASAQAQNRTSIMSLKCFPII